MMNGKMMKSLICVAVLTQTIGAALNRIVIILNRGMPAVGDTVAFGKYVPINQGTRLVLLADVIRVGDYVLSVGDLFFFTGIFTCLIALWIAIPQGRKFFPLLIASVSGIFLSVAQLNNITLTLCEIAAIGTILAIYWKYRSSIKTKVVVKR